ncbi:hypothetical protein ID866_5374 [Astraeus odoratus]|nr:hypothetical protein ID866_5374 [Astraeus odoratus]
MPPFYELAVARFVRASLSPPSSPSSSTSHENSRWAIAVTFSSASGSLLYQITGSRTDYALAAPASVTLSSPSRSSPPPKSSSTTSSQEGIPSGYRYASKVQIGFADSELLHSLHSTLAAIPIVHGDPAWGTREWVMQGVEALRKVEGLFVEKHVSVQWIKEKLGEK